jgi:hypothetical protein
MPNRGGSMTPELFDVAKLLIGGAITLLTGVVLACVTFWIKYPEIRAAIRKTDADTQKVRVEASALQLNTRLSVENAKLLVENINLSAKNAALEDKVSAQATEIAELKRRIADAEIRVARAGREMTEGGMV